MKNNLYAVFLIILISMLVWGSYDTISEIFQTVISNLITKAEPSYTVLGIRG